ncbi:hypothetical protein RRG08_055314 [Elysia crispata]|uniref:Uncharacterized protein n=1 Tax=Elysia crispata TaxID=231223 RepID=A0AAE1E2Y5_9GAST|nr:hypothetical protein RRG08_055314 [Elysia crispata]
MRRAFPPPDLVLAGPELQTGSRGGPLFIINVIHITKLESHSLPWVGLKPGTQLGFRCPNRAAKLKQKSDGGRKEIKNAFETPDLEEPRQGLSDTPLAGATVYGSLVWAARSQCEESRSPVYLWVHDTYRSYVMTKWRHGTEIRAICLSVCLTTSGAQQGDKLD